MGVLPYDDLFHKYDIISGIKSGERPLRPMNRSWNQQLQDSIWDMITTCWSENPKQ